jgi:DNA polymerase III alpha subunit
MLKLDGKFYRLLGRWIADGWWRTDSDLVLGLCFHSDDQAGLKEAVEYFESIGLSPHVRKAANGRKLTQLIVRSRALVAYWRSMFPDYQSTAQTKHIPDFVLHLPVDAVLDLLAGYWSGDGCVGNSQQSKYTATTVSRTLADQIRFLAWRCGIPASLRKDVREDKRGFIIQPSYVITIAKDERLAQKLGVRSKAAQYTWRSVENGTLLRIREIDQVEGVEEVFDLTVEEDHTYQTSSFAVHNSAAGSLVAYSMKITDIDPLQYDLLFERFLNPERVSMPDIDIDFCIHGRQKVIDYVADYYGRDRVSMIATFGTMASKAAIKDVGRALDMPYAEVDKIAKMIPPPVRGRNVSIQQAVKDVPELRKAIDTDERVKNVIEIAKRLEGCSRHTSVHAAGVVISPRPLYELVPVSKTSRDEITTQYSMTDLEKTGMLKMDFLALTTLTIIEDCLKSIERETGERPDLANIPLDDKASLQIFADGKTEAIFQFEGCLSGDTQIGKNRTIKDLYHDVKKLKATGKFALDGRTGITRLKSCFVDDGKFHNNLVLDVIATGIKPVYRIVTEDNYTIKATADHYFLTDRGWVTLGEIDPERDKILFKKDSFYGRRVCVDCGAPLKSMVLAVLRCKACSARITSNPSKPQARRKIALANQGKRPWNYGIDHASSDYKKWHAAIVQAYDKYRGKSLEEIVGSAVAAKRKAEASARFKGTGNPMYGRSQQGRTAYSVAGVRADLGHYVRSAWEADFARVLNYLGVGYEYEPQRFSLQREDGTTMTYAPDFYVPSEKCWYEIKGWMDNRSAEKIRLFQEQYPQEPLVVIDKTRFAELQMQYRDLVQWECPKVPENTSFIKIKRITFEGEEETYDIKMQAPGNNFLANGFVVHNSGMQDLCRRLKPEGLEDLSALNALYRPGPIDSGMVDDFIDRRHGKKKVRYDFNELKDVLGNTLGITVYQEQIMAIFQRLAGYSLGEADLVRRAMGKKKREELDKHKEKFTRQAVERGHDKDKLDKLWASMEGFADYAFNRSHSFAYGQLAYQTAYLKAHYPTHFWAAVMSNELNNTAKVVKYLQEARLQGIQILPPDINESIDTFTARGKTIRFGLAAIKGIGQTAVASMIEARKESAFKSIFDFAERVDSKAVNKRVMEGLVKSGAFDSINTGHRAQLFNAIDSAIESGQRAQKSKASGQVSLFGAVMTEMSAPEPPLPAVEKWSQPEQLKGEKETLGFYLSGHPLQGYEVAIKDIANADIDKLPTFNNGAIVSVGGIIMELAIKTTKKGDRFALCQLEDQYGSVRVVAWPESYKKHASILQNDAPVLVRGRLEVDDGGAMTIYPEEIQSLINIRERAAKLMVMRFPVEAAQEDKLDRLYHLLDSHRGDCEIVFEVELEDGSLALVQPNQFVRVKVTPELTHSITEVMGNACRVELRVGKANNAVRQNSASF